MNNRRVTIRTNIWRACFIGLVLWLLLFRTDLIDSDALGRLLPDVSRLDPLHTITAYAMLGIVVVAVVKLLFQSR